MWAFVSVVATVVLCWAFYKLGQKSAWDYISSEYIAIHKSAIIGPIIIKNKGEKYGKKNYHSNRTHKKASK